jgi:hypothetical protein
MRRVAEWDKSRTAPYKWKLVIAQCFAVIRRRLKEDPAFDPYKWTLTREAVEAYFRFGTDVPHVSEN